MYTVLYTKKFKKSYKLIIKRGLDPTLLDEVITKLKNGETLEERYKDHGLTGIFEGYRECHIKPDWLLIYYIEEDKLILTLVDTGTHSDLFK